MSKYNISPDKGAVITNGYDIDDRRVHYPKIKPEKHSLKFIHPGQIYEKKDVIKFLEVLRELIEENAIGAHEISVQFIGSLPMDQSFLYLEERGVCEYLPRMPKTKVLKLMSNADVFLLFLSNSAFSKGWKFA